MNTYSLKELKFILNINSTINIASNAIFDYLRITAI